MLYFVTCHDKPGGLPLRQATRDAHIKYLEAHAEAFRLGGPFLDDAGEAIIGSMMIVEAPDRAALDALLAQDPYKQAGLFSRIDIRPWRWFIGNPEHH